ncbi:unnamed protein product [Musa acuminata subsp. burmannicoides]
MGFGVWWWQSLLWLWLDNCAHVMAFLHCGVGPVLATGRIRLHGILFFRLLPAKLVTVAG